MVVASSLQGFQTLWKGSHSAAVLMMGSVTVEPWVASASFQGRALGGEGGASCQERGLDGGASFQERELDGGASCQERELEGGASCRVRGLEGGASCVHAWGEGGRGIYRRGREFAQDDFN